MTKVVVLVEGRAKKLFVGGGNVAALRESFSEMCACDPVLKGRIKTHYPTFYSGAKENVEEDLELENEEELTEGQRVRVFFVAYAAVVSRINYVHKWNFICSLIFFRPPPPPQYCKEISFRKFKSLLWMLQAHLAMLGKVPLVSCTYQSKYT